MIHQKRASSIVFFRTALIRNPLTTTQVGMPKNSWEVAVLISTNNQNAQWAINSNKFPNLKETSCFKLKKAMKESMAVMSYLRKGMKTPIKLPVIRPFHTRVSP